jgi:hypothetical protein
LSWLFRSLSDAAKMISATIPDLVRPFDSNGDNPPSIDPVRVALHTGAQGHSFFGLRFTRDVLTASRLEGVECLHFIPKLASQVWGIAPAISVRLLP